MTIHLLHWSGGNVCNMDLREDGSVPWGDGDWHGDWRELSGNLIITLELKERDNRTIPDKPWHTHRALVLPRKWSFTSTEEETS